jgi:VPDSG-CTERM motif
MKQSAMLHSSNPMTQKLMRIFGSALFGLASLVSSAVADTILNMTPGWNGSSGVYNFGLPNTATYGQTVTAPLLDSYLSSFSFEMALPSSATFKGYVFAWDGNKATGSTLYTSPVMSTLGGGFQEITFNTGVVSLNPGGTYVLFASASEVPTSSGTGGWGQPGNSNPYSGGAFVFINNGTNASQWTTTNWVQDFLGTGGDLAFKATFTNVPASGVSDGGSTIALLGLALGGVAAVRRKLGLA